MKSQLDTIDTMLEMAAIGHPFADDWRVRRQIQAQRDMGKLCNSISQLIGDILQGMGR